MIVVSVKHDSFVGKALLGYPFVLFSGGNMIGAYDSWLGFLRNGASKVTEKSYLVLRQDYTTGTVADQKHKSEKSGCDRYL